MPGHDVGAWTRSTGSQRKRAARAKVRFVHVSVLVGYEHDLETGMVNLTRTPKGKGSTAKRATPKLYHSKSHRRQVIKQRRRWREQAPTFAEAA